MSSLIETIEVDAALAQRLAEMPADSQTLTLSLDALASGGSAAGVLQHPSWADSPHVTSPIVGSSSPDANPNQDNLDLAQTIAAGSTAESGDSPTGVNLLDGSTVESQEVMKQALARCEGFLPARRVAMLKADAPKADCESQKDVEYRLIGTLGSGGTGVVYQAHQRAIDREVAIKVLRRELATDASSRGRFLTEARVIGALDHPNVIALHDLCMDDEGQLFYSMKRVDGASWDQQIDTLSLEKNLNILLRVADAIRYAHSRDLVHRDLKPENVMLGRFGEVLVADWGLALSKSSLSPTMESNSDSHHAIGGTPAYMAPELAAGDLTGITYATDIYLLGAILFRIVTGFPPHHGKSLLACIRAAANNVIEQVPDHLSDTEFELIQIASKAMATDPMDRYASVEELIEAIEGHRSHEASDRLVRRAKRRLAEIHDLETPESESADAGSGEPTGKRADRYERFAAVDALLREAIEIWPENRRAIDTLRSTQLEFARTATANGDLDLALILYESAGQSNSEAAARVRKQLERREKVRESQAKYSTLFTHSPDAGMLIRWSDGKVMEANAACLELLGYEKNEMVGQKMSTLSIWACPKSRETFVDQLAREGQIDNFETQFVPKQAQLDEPNCDQTKAPPGLIDVLISSRTVQLSGEEMLLSTVRDISARKAAERELEYSRRRLRDLQRLAGLGSWSFTLQSQAIHWSEEAFRVTGRDSKRGAPDYNEFVGSIHPEDREKLQVAIERSVTQGTSFQLRFRYRDDQGRYRKLFTRGNPVFDAGDNVVEIYGILHPIAAGGG
ncbi:protein kinase domain-containing protein [Rhodopirellula halodulae]|uniref:protein kinase domain-containing protein n=1 Tax=Rhodopirellula halodulae TaxID=2894198 RepID=UPI001E33EC99|nr:protein kinase [Rhodopirellula sp. JC737]MCC9655620.1 protein kinase [Rhodopirellula sp. JC737]